MAVDPGLTLTDLGVSHAGADSVRTLRVDWSESVVARYAHQRIIEEIVRAIGEKIAADLYQQVLASIDVRALATLVLARTASNVVAQFADDNKEKPRAL